MSGVSPSEASTNGASATNTTSRVFVVLAAVLPVLQSLPCCNHS